MIYFLYGIGNSKVELDSATVGTVAPGGMSAAGDFSRRRSTIGKSAVTQTSVMSDHLMNDERKPLLSHGHG